VSEDGQSVANLRAGAAQNPDITKLVLAVLSRFPYGLTTREVRELTGMTSYNASAKLSKLAAKGILQKITIAGDRGHRWRVKPGSEAKTNAKLPGLVERDN
jgi:DNA-binding MarR family transcriptional regulator